MQTRLVKAAPRRILGGTGVPSVVLAVAIGVSGAAYAQIAVPKYQSPVEAPAPHPLSVPTPAAITPNATVVEYPIVRVNDQIIDSSDYERAQQQLLEEAQRQNATPAEVALRQKDLLRDLIDTQLMLSRGKELDLGTSADAEVIRRLDDIRKQNKLDTMEDLEKAVRQSGISYEDFKSGIKNQIIQQEVVRDEVGRKLTLTAKQEQAYYDAHKKEFEQPESVRLSEILIPTPDSPTDAQVAQAQAKADEVMAKLKAGSKFEDMVKQYSGGPNASTDGDLGEYKRGALPKVLEDQTFALKTGEWTTPIRTRQGYVIEAVTDHKAAGVPPLSAVERDVQEAIYQEAIQPAMRAYLTDLREKAYIDIAPGFVDTGASARQTKEVFASSAPLPEKKKTEKKRIVAPPPPKPAAANAAVASPAGASPAGKTVNMEAGKKPKKVKREKIRFGQAPRNSLPEAPEETLTAGADQGAGAVSSALPAPGAAIASADEAANASSDSDPLAPKATTHGKTRYSDRAPTEAKVKAATKAAKVKQKIAATPTPMTTEEKATQQTQSSALGLNGDTATKKKPKKVKGAPKERIQAKPPAPPAPKPEATPIPPKSVRDNGEPVVAPPPDPSKLPPVTPATPQ
ncbi:MAG TPA: peptidylprolyl isomerase [Acidobacteriaceae bacterium]